MSTEVRQITLIFRTKIEEHIFPICGRKTAGFGVAGYVRGIMAKDIIVRADKALYEAKKGEKQGGKLSLNPWNSF
jgi:GGDEF domain-containing protein